MKTAYLQFGTCKDNERTEQNYNRIGNNTGNIVFDHALCNLFKADNVFCSELEEKSWKYNRLIVRDFIWLKEESDMSYFKNVIKMFGKGKKIVPISVGLQAAEYKSDFKLHTNTKEILVELAEQSKLAVRGNYTAEILNKHGIKNIEVIGCPSIYEGGYGFKICKEKEISKCDIVGNYITLSNELNTKKHSEIMEYMALNIEHYIDQNKCYFSSDVIEGFPEIIKRKIIREREIFFIYDDWHKFIAKHKFSIGARFHGNIMAVLAGVPALFLLFDSRVREMTEYFELPTVNIEEFDINKPIEYWYEKADYSKFNKNYNAKMDRFVEFCLKNEIELKEGMDTYFWRKNQRIKNAFEE